LLPPGDAGTERLYVAAADLIPELRREGESSAAFTQLGMLVLGVLVVELPGLIPRLR
jgi:hypothetical protein